MHVCWIYKSTHTLLYVYIHTKCWQGCAGEQGSCCSRPSCLERSFRQREETLSGMSTRQQGGGWLRKRELHMDSVKARRQRRRCVVSERADQDKGRKNEWPRNITKWWPSIWVDWSFKMWVSKRRGSQWTMGLWTAERLRFWSLIRA